MTNAVWPQWMLVVQDVEATSAFYQTVFGLESSHGGAEYDQLTHNGELVMQLHDHDTQDHHGPLRSDDAPVGNGVIVWFEVADFEGTVERIRASGVEIVEDVHENPNAKHLEIWFRDLDGYLVVASGPSPYRPR